MGSSNFLTKEQQKNIVKAIESAELNTSGEIRVHIEPKCKIEVLDRAVYVFNKLKMDKTEQRNGVLIYLAYDSHKFAIIGDKGINDIVPDNFWDEVKVQMFDMFVSANYAGGITYAIEQAGIKLKEFFPYQSDDINEQPNDISFG